MVGTVKIKVTLKVATSQHNFMMLIDAFCFSEPLKSPWMSEKELRAWLTESQLSPAGVFGRGGGYQTGEGEHLFPPRNRFSSGQYGWGGWRRVMIVEAEGLWRAPVLRLILGFMRVWWFQPASLHLMGSISLRTAHCSCTVQNSFHHARNTIWFLKLIQASS